MIFIILSLLLWKKVIYIPDIDGSFLFIAFFSLFALTIATFPIFRNIDNKIFEKIKLNKRKNLLDRTFGTPLILSILGILISIVYLFWSNEYIFVFNISILIYGSLSLFELFRFIYYIRMETK